MQRLDATLEDKSLAKYTTKFLVDISSAESMIMEDIDQLLPQLLAKMVHLHHLAILADDTLFDNFILASIPLSVSLTHLVLGGEWDETGLCAFLESQPFIIFLQIIHVEIEEINLPPDALPNLKTFLGSTKEFTLLAAGRPVENLTLESRFSIFTAASLGHPEDTFRTLRTLSMEFRDVAEFFAIAQYLANLEFLNISAQTSSIFIEDFASLTSKVLRYIRLHGLGYSVSKDRMVNSLFDRFPLLNRVDLAGTSLLGTLPFLRYSRGSALSTEEGLQLQDIWEHWWECLDRAVVLRGKLGAQSSTTYADKVNHEAGEGENNDLSSLVNPY